MYSFFLILAGFWLVKSYLKACNLPQLYYKVNCHTLYSGVVFHCCMMNMYWVFFLWQAELEELGEAEARSKAEAFLDKQKGLKTSPGKINLTNL